MWPTAGLASALVRPALSLTWVCSSRRWLGTASCRPRYNPGTWLASVQGSTVHGSAISDDQGGGGDCTRTGTQMGAGGVVKGSSKSEGDDGHGDEDRVDMCTSASADSARYAPFPSPSGGVVAVAATMALTRGTMSASKANSNHLFWQERLCLAQIAKRHLLR